MNLTLSEMAAAMEAVVHAEGHGRLGERHPSAVRIDSRTVTPGDVFFCIPGERFDGHDFASQALEAGAVAVVAHRPVQLSAEAEAKDCPVLMVDNSIKALGRLARHYRDKARATVVGVTGSAGKTTVKELLAGLLTQHGATAKNQLNRNNQIGLPLSMLEATGEEDFWVMEVGISLPQDMDELGEILAPDLALIVNVGPAHTQGLGGVTGVAMHKARLMAHCREGGEAVLSADYPELLDAAAAYELSQILFTAQDGDAPYRGSYRGAEPGGRGRYRLDMAGMVLTVVLPWRGGFMAENCIAAAATAHRLGLTAEKIQAGLAVAVPAQRRFERHEKGDLVIIDDTYNANPLSMAQALAGAADLAEGCPLMVVLGEMLELGEHAEALHEELGARVAQTGARVVFWRGGHGEAVRKGLLHAGFAGEFTHVERPEDFLTDMRRQDISRGVVLFKGSRGVRMEEFCDALRRELMI